MNPAWRVRCTKRGGETIPDLDKIINAIRQNGPNRVVIDEQGTATIPQRAAKDYGIRPDVIYIRDDGWSLGAPRQFAEVAHKMWFDAWIAVWKRGDDEPTFLPTSAIAFLCHLQYNNLK